MRSLCSHDFTKCSSLLGREQGHADRRLDITVLQYPSPELLAAFALFD